MWEKASSLSSKQQVRRGLNASMLAGALCKEAERLYPDLFRPISLKNGVLRLEVEPTKALETKLIQGELLRALQAFAGRHNLPSPTAIRLTMKAL